ncbi:type I 3-dehydroquinate dehydratase [Thermodesulfobacteriota bacterium]
MFCIPIIARDTDEALEQMVIAAAQADIMEVRLDLMDSFDLHTIIESAVKPILVTYRSDKEGGKGKAGPEAVADYIISAIQEEADLIDVELSMPLKWRERIFDAKGTSKIIVSTHVNDGTPSRRDLEKIFEDSIATDGDIVKIVTRAQRWDDNLRVLELIPAARERGVEVIAFCMGPLGRMSRVFSLLMGAYLTFTSLKTGMESADGQIPAADMKMILEFFTP